MIKAAPILMLLLAMVAAIAGIRGLSPNANYRVYFDEADPAMQKQTRFEAEFARKDALLLIVSPPASNPQQTITHFDTGHPDVRKILQQQYIAKNANTGLIELDVELTDKKSADELNALAVRIQSVASKALPAQSTLEFGGPLALNMAYSDVIKHDLRIFIPGLILLTGLVLYLALGHIGLSVALIVLGAIAVAVASGLAGWLRFEVAAINAFGPVVIVGLSLATQLHLVLACVRQLNEELLFSPSPPVQKLGLTVAFGLIAIYVIGLIVLPVLLTRLNLHPLAKRYAKWQQRLSSFAPKLHRFRHWVVGAFALVLLVTLPALTQLKINDFVYGYFPQEHSFTQSIATETILPALNARLIGYASNLR